MPSSQASSQSSQASSRCSSPDRFSRCSSSTESSRCSTPGFYVEVIPSARPNSNQTTPESVQSPQVQSPPNMTGLQIVSPGVIGGPTLDELWEEHQREMNQASSSQFVHPTIFREARIDNVDGDGNCLFRLFIKIALYILIL